MKIAAFILALTITNSTCTQPSPSPNTSTSTSTSTAKRTVAVTFDDLPGVAMGVCSDGAVRALNDRLLAGIKRNQMPAAALVVPGGHRCRANALRDIMNAWLDAGHELGNHSYSHNDFNKMSLEAYLADVAKGAEAIRPVLAARGQKLRYYRHPLLHAGETVAKKEGLDRFLEREGYDVAPVTVDNQEWVYAERYVTAKARGDSATLRRLIPAYLEHLDESFAYYEALSQKVFGREIPQVLLLHVNLLNTDYLDEIAALMKRRGYEFVRLETALEDPAYKSANSFVGAGGPSWIQRWAITRGINVSPEPREAAWVAGLYR